MKIERVLLLHIVFKSQPCSAFTYKAQYLTVGLHNKKSDMNSLIKQQLDVTHEMITV